MTKTKATGSGRYTVFILCDSAVKAAAWAAENGLGKDKYRYVVNEHVLDVWGPNDRYAVAPGADQHPDHVKIAGIIRARGLEFWK